MLDTKNEPKAAFPFITESGKHSVVSDVVTDLVIWAPQNSVLPFTVTVDLDGDSIALEFTDYMYNVVIKAVPECGYLMDQYNRICGMVRWDEDKVLELKSTLISNDPQPNGAIYVSPSACIVRRSIPLSSVFINGEYIAGPDIAISFDRGSGVIVDTDDQGANTVNMYAKDQLNRAGVIRKLKIKSSEDPGDDVTYTLSGDVWLKSEDICDIRVVTSDEITITEISNDRI